MRQPARLGGSGARAYAEQLLREPALNLLPLLARERACAGRTPLRPLEPPWERVLLEHPIVESLLDHRAEAAAHDVLHILRRQLPVGELGLEPTNILRLEHRERQFTQIPDNDREMATQIPSLRLPNAR